MGKNDPGARIRAAVADGRSMAKIRDFKETVAVRVQSDAAFAQALLDEAITLLVDGEPESAKLILRDLVNATVGFEALADEIRPHDALGGLPPALPRAIARRGTLHF